MVIMGLHIQIKMDNGSVYISNKMKQFFEYYNIKHVTVISHNPTRQGIEERSNQTLRVLPIRQKG
jgi:transposase InsO family protein